MESGMRISHTEKEVLLSEIDKISERMSLFDMVTYRTKLEFRLKELNFQRDKLKEMIIAMDAQKVKVQANIYAFNGAIEEITRCLADIPK